ncbi:type II secretion system protein GspD [Leucothrix sargassi]|nr:type II secretion system protein GspD [Leucothrix sargassi]
MKSELKTCLKNLTLSIGLLLGASSSIQAQSYNLNLRDGDLQAFVSLISTATGKNFVLDKQVRGQKITIITGREIDEDQLYDTFLSVLQLHGLAAVETGEIIKIIPANKSKYQAVPVVPDPTGIEEIDKKRKYQEPDALVTRVIRAKHVPVANMVPILRPMISPTGHLQGYTPSNSILVTDTVANISKLEKIVRQMDSPDEDEMEVVILRFASAPQLVKTIQGLQGTTQQKGVVLKYRVSADEQTNSLLVSGSRSGRQQVKDIVRRLDRPKIKTAEESTQVVYLRYAKAEDLAKVLSGTTTNAVSSEATAEAAAGTQKATTTITADESTNTLIITAEPEVHKNLAEVIKRLDIRRAQVMVEAVIAEVSLGLSHELGLQLGSYDPNGGSALLSSGFDNSSFSVASALSGSFPTTSGLLLGIGGGTVGNAQWGAVLNALQGDVASNILSTPTIVTMDNVEASMVVGQNVPFVTGSTTSGDADDVFQTIEREDVGITLKVTPQINAGSSIMMTLEQEVSSISESTVATDVITNTRSFTTQVMVEDGQMLVIGGLIEDKYDDSVQKVPVLGDLPFIGRAFRSTTRTKTQQNLMVFIHPVIMRDVLTANNYTLEKYSDIRGIQRNSGIESRGKDNIRARQFPDDPSSLLAQGTTTERQQQLKRYAEETQRQANTQTHSYQPYARAPQVQRPNRPLTTQQRQQIAKQREREQQLALQRSRQLAQQKEQQIRAANQRRRDEVLRQNRLRAEQARIKALQAGN